MRGKRFPRLVRSNTSRRTAAGCPLSRRNYLSRAHIYGRAAHAGVGGGDFLDIKFAQNRSPPLLTSARRDIIRSCMRLWQASHKSQLAHSEALFNRPGSCEELPGRLCFVCFLNLKLHSRSLRIAWQPGGRTAGNRSTSLAHCRYIRQCITDRRTNQLADENQTGRVVRTFRPAHLISSLLCELSPLLYRVRHRELARACSLPAREVVVSQG